MSFTTPSVPTPAAPVLPPAPAAPQPFGTQQTPGQKPQAKSSQPTSLMGGMFSNPTNTGQKTLLGQ